MRDLWKFFLACVGVSLWLWLVMSLVGCAATKGSCVWPDGRRVDFVAISVFSKRDYAVEVTTGTATMGGRTDHDAAKEALKSIAEIAAKAGVSAVVP